MSNRVSRRSVLFGAAGLAVTGLVPLAPGARAASAEQPNVEAARAAIGRLLGRDTGQFVLQALPSDGAGDRFTVGGRAGQVVLAGTSTGALVSAFHWWLKYVAGGHLSWNGDQLALPETFPAGTADLRTELTDRYAYNFCVFGYTAPYWTWPDWERELDYLAASGVNRALSLVGQEIVWYETYPQFGLSRADVLKWIPYSAHQPWVWYGSISVGGSVTTGFLQRRAELGARINDRMRELGITPVFPAYIGHVPNALFAQANPAAKVLAQGTYNGQPRPDWLASTDPLFPKVAKQFYAAQTAHFGVTTHYSNDLLHEGGTTGDVPLASAAKAVQAAMPASSVWVLQGWAGNPRKELVDAIDKTRALVIDLDADAKEDWRTTSEYWGAPWAWGSIGNFGGRLGMFGSLHKPAETLPAIRALPAAERGRLQGTAAMAEAHHHNPVTGDLWSETAWRTEPVDLTTWIQGYATRRYGRTDPHAGQAWATLLDTAYSWTGSSAGGEGPYETPFAALPNLTVTRSSRTAPSSPRYDLDLFPPAFVQLWAADPALRSLPTYRYDLVDVTRQLLADRSRHLLDEIRAAYQAKDLAQLRTLTARFLRYLDLTDELLGTEEHWLLGAWLAAARSWGATDAERAQLEYDARSIITIWTPKAYERLREYANREWNGLLADYYRPRWAAYFADVIARVQAGNTTLPSSEPAAWADFSEGWTQETKTYPATPAGDTYATVARIVAELTAEPGQGVVRVFPPQEQLGTPGVPARLTVRFTNRDPGRARTTVHTGLTSATAVGAADFASVAAGASVTTTWQLTLPAAPPPADSAVTTLTLTGSASYVDGTTTYQASAATVVRAGLPPQAPNQTYATTSGGAAQYGSRYTIFAAGHDMWNGTQEFGAVYRQAALGSGESVVTTVTRQDNTGPWARAGILVRNSVTTPASPAAVVLARTPGNGVAMQWDSTGGGGIDKTVSLAWPSGAVWLKLSRSGSRFTGYAGSDGTQWQQVGQADVPGAATRVDAALFTCAVNADGAIGAAEFSGFRIVRAATSGNDLQRYQSSGKVVAAPGKDGRLELFVAAADGVWHRWQTAVNAGWSAWEHVGGPAGATLAIGRNAAGTLELFATGPQGTKQRSQTAANAGWGAWQDTAGPAGRDIVIGPSEDGRLEVFVAAADGIWHRWRTTSGTWSAWQNDGGPSATALGIGRETGGTLVLFAGAADGTYQRDQYAINAGWGPWLPIGPAGTDLAVAPSLDGRLELLLATSSGVLHRYQGTASGDWSAFTPVGGPASARLALSRDPDGLLQAFAVTASQAWQRAQTAPNAGWGAWQQTGTGGSDVDLSVDADGRLEAHLVRPDQLWVRFQRSPDHSWSDWQPFGGL